MLFKKKETSVKNLNDQKFEIVNWVIEFNAPYGFVVKNTQDVKPEYHFFGESNGWISSLVMRKKEKQTGVLNFAGKLGGQVILVDKENATKYSRFIELQKKGKSLNESEMKELLVLMGVME